MYQRELWASCWGWFLRSRKGIISIVKFWPGRGDKPTEKGLCIEWICDMIQTDLVNCRFGDVLIVSTCPLKLQETQDQQPNQEWKTTFFPLIVFHCVFLCFLGGLHHLHLKIFDTKILRSHVDRGPTFAFAFRFVATGFVAFLGTETQLVSWSFVEVGSNPRFDGFMGFLISKRVGYFGCLPTNFSIFNKSSKDLEYVPLQRIF